jgi:hypothetical protein
MEEFQGIGTLQRKTTLPSLQDCESSEESHKEKEENDIPRKGEREILRGSKMPNIVNIPEPEYPKLGEPLKSYEPNPKNKHTEYWQGHIILDRDNGIFLNLGFDSESDCLEYSANYLADLRRNWRSLGKI